MEPGTLLEQLRRKDELIVQLKRLVADQSATIDRLQAQGILGDPPAELPPPPVAAAKPSVPAAREAGRFDDWLDPVRSTGVFPDGWLAQEARLVFAAPHPNVELEFTFFLPHQDSQAKEVRVLPNFAGGRTLSIARGKPFVDSYSIPADLPIAPDFHVIAASVEQNVQDLRNLGVLLIKISVN